MGHLQAWLDALEQGVSAEDATEDRNAHTGFYVANEFAVLITSLKKKYNEGLTETLTDVYDSPHRISRRTKGTGEIVLAEPFVAMLMASTIEWVTAKLDQTDLQSGFLPRFSFIPAHKRTRYLEFPDQGHGDDWDDLVTSLKRLASCEGSLRFSHDAMRKVSGVFEGRAAGQSAEEDAFLTRGRTNLLRLSLIHGADVGATQVEVDHIEQVVPTWEWLQGVIPRLVEEELAFTKEGQLRVRVISYIRQNGNRVTRMDLLRASRMRKRQFDSLIDTLLAGGVLATSSPNGGRTIYYELRDYFNRVQKHESNPPGH